MDTMEVILAAALLLSFALHYVARKTKNTYDDKFAELFDLLRALLPGLKKPPQS